MTDPLSQARARTTDPVTSHEAAATVDPSPSQDTVLTIARHYLGQYFTDTGLVETYHRIRETAELPRLSDSRLRTARRELVDAQQIRHAGYTEPATGRRHSIWELLK